MKLKRIRCILSIALVLSSFSVNAYADVNEDPNYGISLTGILGDSVIIDKGSASGDNILLPEDVLQDLDNIAKPGTEITDEPIDETISTWGDGVATGNTNSSGSSATQVISKKGSIKITLPDISEKNDKSGVKFAISKVADITGGEYQLVDTYKEVDVSLNDMESSNDLEIAANLLQKVASADNTLVTNSNGKCSIDDLDVGVYLVYATDIAKYENITPFLISIPAWDESTKTMSYDVEVIPKHTPLQVETPSQSKAPATGYSGGDIYGVLSGVSLALGTGVLAVKRKKEY